MGIFKDFYFSYKNNLKAKNLPKYRPWLPFNFYPDWRGGLLDTRRNYWYKRGCLGNFLNKRVGATSRWVEVNYKQSNKMPGFDTRDTTNRYLVFKIPKIDESNIHTIMSIAEAYQTYIGKSLYFIVNKSNRISNLSFLRLHLETLR